MCMFYVQRVCMCVCQKSVRGVCVCVCVCVSSPRVMCARFAVNEETSSILCTCVSVLCLRMRVGG